MNRQVDREQWKEKLEQNKVCCFDIDGVIFENNFPHYDQAKPLRNNIKIINELYSKDFLIVLNTARGWLTQQDWIERTEQQLRHYGVQYHYLYADKPPANYYIDDHNLNLQHIEELTNE